MFFPLQRWFNSAELELGLGIIMTSDHRSVTIHFPAVEAIRTYARESAPLIRAKFGEGEKVHDQSGRLFEIKQLEQEEEIITYLGIYVDTLEPDKLHEAEIGSREHPSRPLDRLLSGQLDSNAQFELRHLAHKLHAKHAAGETRGLQGGRTLLLPHQLYIAHEVAQRHVPRVLLADEVGLGKTIEAGMIIHHQLLNGFAQRVLIVVPESLQFQWLVEMKRRFNLNFALISEPEQSDSTKENSFEESQLIICSLPLLTQNPASVEDASTAGWDLMIVDEAHHLTWNDTDVSHEYEVIESLASHAQGLLLLTATPEQTGLSSHFACLRLLDAQRFHSLPAFQQETQKYGTYAQVAEKLLSRTALEEADVTLLQETLTQQEATTLLQGYTSNDESVQIDCAHSLIEALIDRHGTGRVLYRNTRRTIGGFPERQLKPVPLEGVTVTKKTGERHGIALLPENALRKEYAEAWPAKDPRIHWLQDFLSAHPAEKCLLITADKQTVLEISEWLKTRTAVKACAFHEGLSILERDRAAAYFADTENGAQLMLCSEIGSEGRNFQFASYLILFDLPLNPDLLQQRIGRLDRIGQQNTIHIHVPYFGSSSQERLFRWYQDGLNAFTTISRSASEIFSRQHEKLHQMLDLDTDSATFDAFISETVTLAQTLDQEMEEGRDLLMDFHSNHPQEGNRLKESIESYHLDEEIQRFFEKFADIAGFSLEPYRGYDSFIAKPDPQRASGVCPSLPEEGLAVTFNRDRALQNEDLQFITWEHPLTLDIFDRVQSSELGNTAAGILRTAAIRSGMLLIESTFVLRPIAVRKLHANRYLPPHVFRLLISANGEDLTATLTHDEICQQTHSLPPAIARKLLGQFKSPIKNTIQSATEKAQSLATDFLHEAKVKAEEILHKESERLHFLQSVNPNIRAEEIAALEVEKSALQQLFSSSECQLDALRILFTQPIE